MSVQLVINVDDAGALTVTGPLSNLLACYGLLEAARDEIKRHHDEQKVRPANAADLRLVTGK